MNLVTFELFADAVAPREQIHNIGVALDADQLDRFIAGDLSAVENPLAQLGNAFPNRHLYC